MAGSRVHFQTGDKNGIYCLSRAAHRLGACVNSLAVRGGFGLPFNFHKLGSRKMKNIICTISSLATIGLFLSIFYFEPALPEFAIIVLLLFACVGISSHVTEKKAQ